MDNLRTLVRYMILVSSFIYWVQGGSSNIIYIDNLYVYNCIYLFLPTRIYKHICVLYNVSLLNLFIVDVVIRFVGMESKGENRGVREGGTKNPSIGRRPEFRETGRTSESIIGV